MSNTRLPYDTKAYESKVKMSTHPNEKKMQRQEAEDLYCLPNVKGNPGNCLPFDSKQVHIESFLMNRTNPLQKYDNASTCNDNICVNQNEKIAKLDNCTDFENCNSLVSHPRSDYRELSTSHILFATQSVNDINRVDDRMSVDSRRMVSDIHKRFYPKRC